MLAQRNVNYLVFASLVMISSKLRTYLDHLRWGSEAIPFKIVNDVSFYSLQSALASAFTHRNVNSFISHRTWWFVWLRSAIYYNNERSSYSKSQCQYKVKLITSGSTCDYCNSKVASTKALQRSSNKIQVTNCMCTLCYSFDPDNKVCSALTNWRV